jgi:anaerobic dimethyl sulfoxide reductase subunit A
MPSMPFFCGKDCGGNACPLMAQVDNGRVLRVESNPLARGFPRPCRRGFDIPLEQNSPDRLLTPLVRTGPRGSGSFRAAAWDEALEITADALGEIRARYGATAVACAGSGGTIGALHFTGALLARFLGMYGGYTRLAGGYSLAAMQFVLPYVLGADWTRAGFDPAAMRHSRMIILWGANVLETRQGADVPRQVMDARRRGAQVVVIDPRRTVTVKRASTWWIPCRPGTDAALMLAVLHVVCSRGLVDRSFVAAHASGFDSLERYVLGLDDGVPKSPAWASPRCGVEVGEIVRFALAYAASRPALLLPGLSIQRVFAGEDPSRLAVALQVATGNFGIRGGSTGAPNHMLPSPRVGRLSVPGRATQPSIPSVRLPDAILQGTGGGYPTDIHALYALGSNVLNQGGDIRKNIAAFQKLDFAVTHSIFMTPTAKYCDVVFPAATAFEKEDIGIPWSGNYLLYKPRVVPPAGQARSDYDALCGLAERMGFDADFSEGRSAAQWIQHFLEESEIPDPSEFRRSGLYAARENERVGLEDFARDPMSHPLATRSGKVEIASATYFAETGFSSFPRWQEPPRSDRYPLLLVTPKSPHFTHSQGRNIGELRERAGHALEISPGDASLRGLREGDMASLFNSAGEVRIAVHLSDDLVPGVVSLTEGAWWELDESGVDVGGSANMLTTTEGTAPGTAPIMHGVRVEVRPA